MQIKEIEKCLVLAIFNLKNILLKYICIGYILQTIVIIIINYFLIGVSF